MFPLKSMAHNMAKASEAPWRQVMIAEYDGALQAIARTYNHRNAEDPIQTIRI
jgi:hypothetical protein